MRPAVRGHPIETPVRNATLKIGTTTASEAARATALDHTAYEQEPGVEDGVGARVVGVVEESEVDQAGAVVQGGEDDPLAGASC